MIGGWRAEWGGDRPGEVWPMDDLREHDIGGATTCWCRPRLDGDVLVHNSMDRREEYERGRKPS